MSLGTWIESIQITKGRCGIQNFVVEKFVRNTKREISIDHIQKVVSEYFQMDVTTLQSKTRKRHIVQARQH